MNQEITPEILEITSRTDRDVDNSSIVLKVQEKTKDDFGTDVISYKKQIKNTSKYLEEVNEQIQTLQNSIEFYRNLDIDKEIKNIQDKIDEITSHQAEINTRLSQLPVQELPAQEINI